MKIGYARVSARQQNLDMQLEAFRKEGCEKIYQEKKTPSRNVLNSHRPWMIFGQATPSTFGRFSDSAVIRHLITTYKDLTDKYKEKWIANRNIRTKKGNIFLFATLNVQN